MLEEKARQTAKFMVVQLIFQVNPSEEGIKLSLAMMYTDRHFFSKETDDYGRAIRQNYYRCW
ncbi:hypothetical protein CRENPOLYSF1_1260008 [Crenothrix polyspora]|uniref:Uncharacterized protein n=1 Tax=Crenothrix polyspora TaxID=360316 RepID=A0A1R4H0Z5_9GAMM|nr:hypothetical protein CRENPOLYSF1_1260008 [Crenothrix polyspora]